MCLSHIIAKVATNVHIVSYSSITSNDVHVIFYNCT